MTVLTPIRSYVAWKRAYFRQAPFDQIDDVFPAHLRLALEPRAAPEKAASCILSQDLTLRVGQPLRCNLDVPSDAPVKGVPKGHAHSAPLLLDRSVAGLLDVADVGPVHIRNIDHDGGTRIAGQCIQTEIILPENLAHEVL